MPKSAPLFLSRSYWILAAILIAFIGVAVAFWDYKDIDKSLRQSLIDRARTVAAALDDNNITHLSGSAADLTNVDYIDLKRQLTNIRAINSDTRFAYVFGIQNNSVFFYADSEPTDSNDYSPPGQIYSEASPELLQAFKDGQSFVEGPSQDRWGTWLSGLAPIYDTKSANNKTIIGIFGMDISNSFRQKQILKAMFAIAGLTVLAELLLLVYYFYWRYKKKTKTANEEQKIRERQYEFVSMISHQLRTPIAGARSILEILKDEKGFEQLNDVYVKIDHLNSIVATLLFFIENENVLGRKKIKTKKTADLAAVIRNQLEFSKKVINDKKIVVNLKVPKKLILPVDEVLLNRIIYSLIENAVIYNKEFGTIDITLHSDSDHPVLVITDSGYGIPAKEQALVFNSFFRATNASLALNEGSGLSLYLNKEIMRLIGGSITFESTEGEGSTFYLHFNIKSKK